MVELRGPRSCCTAEGREKKWTSLLNDSVNCSVYRLKLIFFLGVSFTNALCRAGTPRLVLEKSLVILYENSNVRLPDSQIAL